MVCPPPRWRALGFKPGAAHRAGKTADDSMKYATIVNSVNSCAQVRSAPGLSRRQRIAPPGRSPPSAPSGSPRRPTAGLPQRSASAAAASACTPGFQPAHRWPAAAFSFSGEGCCVAPSSRRPIAGLSGRVAPGAGVRAGAAPPPLPASRRRYRDRPSATPGRPGETPGVHTPPRPRTARLGSRGYTRGSAGAHRSGVGVSARRRLTK